MLVLIDTLRPFRLLDVPAQSDHHLYLEFILMNLILWIKIYSSCKIVRNFLFSFDKFWFLRLLCLCVWCDLDLFVDPSSLHIVCIPHQCFKIGSFVKGLLNNLTIKGPAQLIQKLMLASSLGMRQFCQKLNISPALFFSIPNSTDEFECMGDDSSFCASEKKDFWPRGKKGHTKLQKPGFMQFDWFEISPLFSISSFGCKNRILL